MQIEELYISLIVRYLKKEISEEEKQELFKWIYLNHENEKFFYHIKDIWETAGYNQISKSAETDNEWEKLALKAIRKESIHFVNGKNSVRKLYKAIQIAALVIVTFGIGFLVKMYLPEKVEYSSVTVPYGAKTELQLSDGSTVWVNSGSTLKYPTRLNNKEVDLMLEGEAFFDITKNNKRKLNVKTSTINIQVHGTTFNVKSYPDEDVVETTLLEGSISITGKVGNRVISSPIYLKPNEQATLTKSENRLSVGDNSVSSDLNAESEDSENVKRSIPLIQPTLKITEGIDPEEFVMWKYNVLVFKNERFEDLSKKMERWYNVKITINNEDLKSSRYTGTFEKETIEQALKALSLSLPFKYKIDKNQITILKK